MERTQGKFSHYIALLLYEASSPAPDYKPLYEETFVLIQATSIEEAREKANRYALREQTSYFNGQGEEINRLLKHVVDVNAVLYETFEDETELYARYFRNYEAYRLFEPLLGGDI